MAGRTGKVTGDAQPAHPGMDPGGVPNVGDDPITQGDHRPLPDDPLGRQTRPAEHEVTYLHRDMRSTADGLNDGSHVVIGDEDGVPVGQHEPGPYPVAPVDRQVPGTWSDTLPRG